MSFKDIGGGPGKVKAKAALGAGVGLRIFEEMKARAG
jgi:hypothetical protein